ncbi:gluconate 2-dehydrogenase subunit 3 family protein [Rubrivirga sp. IMCC43871]|uniref:gluconate 2-dehydrogenase subunit 3 family protein n=1 Tax=Rubrivirga sp. IMCC43871 TaxID=3391575 RepID=UPI00398FAE3D
MAPITRRDALRRLAVAAAAPALLAACQGEDVAGSAMRHAAGASEMQPAIGATPTFFTPHEFETVRTLAGIVLPADDRGPSAAETGTPELIDWVMTDELLGDPTSRQTLIRGGLAWLDGEARDLGADSFVAATDVQQRQLLDRIAYPESAAPEDEAGVSFFSLFRNYVATGYFSSPQGIEDLGYLGNVARSEWTGCPDDANAYAARTA